MQNQRLPQTALGPSQDAPGLQDAAFVLSHPEDALPSEVNPVRALGAVSQQHTAFSIVLNVVKLH